MPTERRESERIQNKLRVEFKGVKDFLFEYSENISKGGIFLKSKETLPVGTKITLEISLPEKKEPITVTGTVAHSVSFEEHQRLNTTHYGMGIKFDNFTKKDEENFFKYISEISRG